MMKILSVASECVPLVKTGGLADVVGALPAALATEGVDMRVLLPGYRAVMNALKRPKMVAEWSDFFGGSAKVLSGKAAGLSVIVLQADHLFDRDGSPYLDAAGKDWSDNAERYAALSWAAAELAAKGAGRWTPDVLHCHDWQAGFAAYYLKTYWPDADVATILTIHNIAFHGLAPSRKLNALRLKKADFNQGGFEFWDQINALKAGLVWSDLLTTVSPTYGRELMRKDFGMGLEGVIRSRVSDMHGILNGIDPETWNPATDPAIPRTYKTPRGKARNKTALRKEFDLPETDGPLCLVISRLSEQKGLDLLLEALPALLDQGGQLALLGSGDPKLEADFRKAAAHENVGVHIGYDEAMAHRMMAGGDAILVPSRFEPCGLTQLYGLRYGTIPLVALTGGLVDTVIPVTPATQAVGAATGMQIFPLTSHTLATGLNDLCALFRDKATWLRLQKNAMAHPVDWAASAVRYAELYRRLSPTA